jgi:hypothetical protein
VTTNGRLLTDVGQRCALVRRSNPGRQAGGIPVEYQRPSVRRLERGGLSAERLQCADLKRA